MYKVDLLVPGLEHCIKRSAGTENKTVLQSSVYNYHSHIYKHTHTHTHSLMPPAFPTASHRSHLLQLIKILGA